MRFRRRNIVECSTPSVRAAPLSDPARAISSTQRKSSHPREAVRFCKAALRISGILVGASAPYVEQPADVAAQRRLIMLKFKDKVVLLIGATAGIGRATAEAFAEAGATLFLTGRNSAAGEDLTAGLRSRGARV